MQKHRYKKYIYIEFCIITESLVFPQRHTPVIIKTKIMLTITAC